MERRSAFMDAHEPPPEERRKLELQALVGWATFALVGPGAVFTMRGIRANRMAGLEEARRKYRAALANGRPTVVCANHLTMVDSAYLHHGLAPLSDYLRDFRKFSWNVPATENFTKSFLLRTLVYVGKCIPIDRSADASHHKEVLDKIKHLVRNGQPCMIFPEGGRSRTGRVEPANVTYGVGQILKDLDRPQVVCAYLRGERQASWGGLPARGDTMHLSVEVIEPTTTETGLRAARDLSRQVITKLADMEKAHFARLGQG
ncbi:MAG: 1-acyl-sn-glycerol-3-phosphate acyltransferase [Polyangiales bacterium]